LNTTSTIDTAKHETHNASLNTGNSHHSRAINWQNYEAQHDNSSLFNGTGYTHETSVVVIYA